MIEVAAIVCVNGTQWHGPTGVAEDASHTLRELIERVHSTVIGVAFSRPGEGIPMASRIDLETFETIERALGYSLVWWIASSDRLVQITNRAWPIARYQYHTRVVPVDEEHETGPLRVHRWLPKLRDLGRRADAR